MRRNRYRETEILMREFSLRKTAIRQRLSDFAVVAPKEYFYELAYCLLTPQSSAVRADAAVHALRRADFLHTDIDPAPILRTASTYIRFHNTKAHNLIEAKDRFGSILQVLRNGHTSVETRQWLVDNVRGFGWKEASHFLRNIGHRDLAILDRHIIRNLIRHNVIRSSPKSLTKKEYLSIEERFRKFADALCITIDELDLLFWSSETGKILK